MSYYDTLIEGTSGLKAYYRENETSATVAHDSTSNGYNGTYAGSLSYSISGAINGDSDTAIGFTASGGLNIPWSTLNITTWTAITVEFWIKISGAWQYVAATSNSTTDLLYLNGIAFVSGAGDEVVIDQGFAFVGSPNASDMAKTAIYNVVLTPTQILQHFSVGQALFSGGATLYANGTGTASFDSFRVAAYPDPSVSLANAGRATNSLVNHNGNFPNNTSVAIQTSTDNGITWQNNASGGAAIAGISTLLFSTPILQKQPSHYYHLSDIVGTTSPVDSSGNGYTGTVHGTVTFGAAGVLQGPGELGNTIALFDGTTGYISAATTGLPTGASAFSVGCWYKNPSSMIGLNYPVLVSYGTRASNEEVLLYFNQSDGHLHFAAGNYDIDGGKPSDNTYHFVIGSFDGSTMTLYVDGKSVGTLSATPNIVLSHYYIGLDIEGDFGWFPGEIGEVFNLSVPVSVSDALAVYNAGLAGIGQEASDSFTSNTSTSYTQTFGTGGSAATWTWDTANSRLKAIGGSKAVALYSNLWAYDVDILIDLYQSENAGLVWGWQNASNYYELIVTDSLASSPNTATINKISGGSSTQLATTSITWQVVSGGVTINQVHHRFHMTMLSGVITVSMDENTILTYTDSSPFPAGLAGIRNDTGTSYIYLLQITPQPVSVINQYLCVKHALSTTDPTVTPQITDHQALVSDDTLGVGATIPQVDYSKAYVSDNIDDANTKSNYWWQVSGGKVVFQPTNAANAPYILQSTDIMTGTLPTVEYSGDMYRNEQVLKGVYQTSIFTQTFTGDGQSKTWNVANPVEAVPTITVNGLTQTVGIQGTDTGKAYYYQIGSTAITQDNSGTILRNGIDVLSVAYLGSYGIDFTLDNTGQISNTISQATLAATDGTSGIVAAIEDVSSQNMNLTAATAYANQLLQRYGSIARTINFYTLHSGLKTGQSLPIFVPQLNIFDSTFLVVQVETSVRAINVGGFIAPQYVYNCIASETSALSSWVKLFSKVLRSVSGTKAHV